MRGGQLEWERGKEEVQVPFLSIYQIFTMCQALRSDLESHLLVCILQPLGGTRLSHVPF